MRSVKNVAMVTVYLHVRVLQQSSCLVSANKKTSGHSAEPHEQDNPGDERRARHVR